MQKCETCKWHDDFTGVCCNGYSPKVADFTDNDDCCEEWAKHEEMVDWMAIQIPKIIKAYEWCECL